MKRLRFCEHLLAEIPRENVDDDVLEHIDTASRRAQVECILLRGLVTGKLWVVFHAGPRTAKQYIRHAEREELAALPTTGVMQ